MNVAAAEQQVDDTPSSLTAIQKRVRKLSKPTIQNNDNNDDVPRRPPSPPAAPAPAPPLRARRPRPRADVPALPNDDTMSSLPVKPVTEVVTTKNGRGSDANWGQANEFNFKVAQCANDDFGDGLIQRWKSQAKSACTGSGLSSMTAYSLTQVIPHDQFYTTPRSFVSKMMS
jgi:hypothetical protein